LSNLTYLPWFLGGDVGREYLECFASCSDIESVIVLPTFKTKNVPDPVARNGQVFTRADDIIVTAGVLNPRLTGFGVGCGQASFLIDAECPSDFRERIEATLEDFVLSAAHTRRTFGIRLKQKFLGRLPLNHFDNQYSIKPGRWLKIVTSGVRCFLESVGDPFAFWDHLDAFGGSGNHFHGNIEKLRDLLDDTWLMGKSHPVHDELAVGIQGSHFLDLLVIDSILCPDIKRFGPYSLGKMVLHIHAPGARYSQVLRGEVLRQWCAGKPPSGYTSLYEVACLMKNQSAINRTAIALSFLECFKKHFGELSVTPISEQAHYDVERIDSATYKYFCNVLRPSFSTLMVLPSGHPFGHSFLVKKGGKSCHPEAGLPHSLKKVINSDPKVRELDIPVYIYQHCFPERLFLGKCFSQGKPFVASLERKAFVSPEAKQIVDSFQSMGISQTCAVLRPLLRFSGRKQYNKSIVIPGT